MDVGELARLENPENASDGKIRVKMPNKKVNEMFALASQIWVVAVTVLVQTVKHAWLDSLKDASSPMGARRLDHRLAMDFQDSKADVKNCYTKTQAMYLPEKESFRTMLTCLAWASPTMTGSMMICLSEVWSMTNLRQKLKGTMT